MWQYRQDHVITFGTMSEFVAWSSCFAAICPKPKRILYTQHPLGIFQLVSFFVIWPIIIGSVQSYFKEELKCDVDKGKNDFINRFCSMQYIEQYSPIHLYILAALNWIVVVVCGWVPYTWKAYIISKNNNEGTPVYARPKVREYYVGQITVRALLLLVFMVVVIAVIVKINPTNSGFKFPVQFKCTLKNNTASGLSTMTSVPCLDKYHNKKTEVGTAIPILDAVYFVFAIIELLVVLHRCTFSNNNSLEETQGVYVEC